MQMCDIELSGALILYRNEKGKLTVLVKFAWELPSETHY